MAVKKTTKAAAEETAAAKKTATSKTKKTTSKKKEEKPADPETKPCGCVGECKCGEKGDANQVNIDIKINGKPASAEDIKNIVDALEVIDNVKTFMSKQRAQMEERFKAIQKRFNDFWTF